MIWAGIADIVDTSRQNFTEFGDLVSRCCWLLSNFVYSKVCFIRRQVNKVAHSLAKFATSLACPEVWLVKPDFIVDLLVQDCNIWAGISIHS